MRSIGLWVGMVGFAMLAPQGIAGCFAYEEDCELTQQCAPPGGSGGSGGSTPAACMPSEAGGPVGDECGVFVGGAAASDENAGSKAAPVATLGAAIAMAGGKGGRVYACNEEFGEAIEVPAGVEIYGGLDCAGEWKYVEGQKTTIAPAADQVPVTLLGGEGARIEDVAATAADAATPGGSSIAVIAQEGAVVELLRCELRAGAGAAGAAGETPTEVGANGEGQNGKNGVDGIDNGMACTTMTGSLGGSGGQLTCNGIDVSGGRGGAGTPDNIGGDANDGQPQPGPMPLDGKRGIGQPDTGQCSQGNGGALGMPGLSGPGATGIGDISGSGYTAASASPGMSVGTPGQGGGGGGGARKCPNNNAGPSGGGGGSGGCGGAAGKGGGAGGSSIGLLSHQAKVTLRKVAITTAAGGAGGVGGKGQAGGAGGQPGLGGAANSCPGGLGGAGGRGGAGGGGLGGHSVGIASKGPAPVEDGVTINAGTAGAGGVGGDGDVATQGANGQGCKTLNFDEAGSCQ